METGIAVILAGITVLLTLLLVVVFNEAFKLKDGLAGKAIASHASLMSVLRFWEEWDFVSKQEKIIKAVQLTEEALSFMEIESWNDKAEVYCREIGAIRDSVFLIGSKGAGIDRDQFECQAKNIEFSYKRIIHNYERKLVKSMLAVFSVVVLLIVVGFFIGITSVIL